MWYILCVVTWSPVKSKIIKQRSNIFKIDSVVSTKLFPEPQERPEKSFVNEQAEDKCSWRIIASI